MKNNVGLHFETWNTGVLGPVVLHGIDRGSRDLTWQKWSYQVETRLQTSSPPYHEENIEMFYLSHHVGLKGEAMNLNSLEGASSVEWMKGSLVAQNQQPLTWYRVCNEPQFKLSVNMPLFDISKYCLDFCFSGLF